MSDFFNYTFDIVNPDTITQNGATGASSYPAVASAVPSIIYAPSSYFYTDVTKIADAVSANLTTDAFGPVSGSETTKYRVTSFIRSTTSDLVKVFAISDGQIFIQPRSIYCNDRCNASDGTNTVCKKCADLGLEYWCIVYYCCIFNFCYWDFDGRMVK